MGTRADFYIHKDGKTEWLGSVAMDGYDVYEINGEGKSDRTKATYALKRARTEDEFRAALIDYFETRDDVTTQDHGWPWPWDDSKTTDFAYVFRMDRSEVEAYSFGECACCGRAPAFEWPDMSARKNVTLGPRSGLIVLTAKG